MQLPHLGLSRLDTLVEESIDFIYRHFKGETADVAISGGKDSTVLYWLTKEAEEKYPELEFRYHYMNTTIDPPELVKFVRDEYPDVVELKAPPFFKMVRNRGFPLRTIRWCCDTQKKHVCKSMKTLTGVRASESWARARRGQIVRGYSTVNYNPIFNWQCGERKDSNGERHYDIWDYIKDRGIRYCDLYDEGFNRLGCVVCPFITGKDKGTRKRQKQHMERWPKHWEAFRRAFFDVWRRKAETIEMYRNLSPEIGWERWLLGGQIFDRPEDNAALELDLLQDDESETEE